jgi:hypothetical protein
MKLLSLATAAAALLLSAAPASAGTWMRVTDPPSNVRDAPNGRIICSIPERRNIYVTSELGYWYYVTISGCPGNSIGWIHRSQVKTVAPVKTESFSGYCILRGQAVPDAMCY